MQEEITFNVKDVAFIQIMTVISCYPNMDVMILKTMYDEFVEKLSKTNLEEVRKLITEFEESYNKIQEEEKQKKTPIITLK